MSPCHSITSPAGAADNVVAPAVVPLPVGVPVAPEPAVVAAGQMMLADAVRAAAAAPAAVAHAAVAAMPADKALTAADAAGLAASGDGGSSDSGG